MNPSETLPEIPEQFRQYAPPTDGGDPEWFKYTRPEFWHPAASCFPLLDQKDELDALSEDIQARGLRQPIILCDGKVLDGRNRIRACALRNIEPEFEEHNGDDPVSFVVSLNLRRRNLTASQLAMSAAKIQDLYAAEAKKRQATSTGGSNPQLVANLPPAEKRSREKAAQLVGASPRYTQDAIAILRASPDLTEKVMSGKMSVFAAKRQITPYSEEENGDDRYRKLRSFVGGLYRDLPPQQRRDEILEHAIQLIDSLASSSGKAGGVLFEKIMVQFEDRLAVEEFAKRIGKIILPGTQYIWYETQPTKSKKRATSGKPAGRSRHRKDK